MTAFNHLCRALAVSALTALGAGGAHADASWDIDACSGGTKSASGFTGCTGTSAGGVTLNVKAYTSTGSTTNFSAASINTQNGYIGVLSGGETGGTSPHHAIDNVRTSGQSSTGNAYELVLLQFSKAVDLSQLVATWTNTQSGGDADFQVYRWNYNSTTPDPTVTNFNPSSMTGWQLVTTTTGDFADSLTQGITDGTYYSSYWLISTAFGGSNDAFKLGTVSAANVCLTSQTSTGGCAPTQGPGVPEPMSLALFGVAALGAGAARRRALAQRV